jgi:hypothetical protein
MSTIMHPRWTALRGQVQHVRNTHATRRALVRELSTYTNQSDLDDLHAILNQYPEEETADIRRILARRTARAL